ncbi:MAG: hypothetical protein CUN55_04060 [Phototrophicales bacterium]|nr:MAG: hypothetical protein CUN55_04060 [Phototrophicales bacterium]
MVTKEQINDMASFQVRPAMHPDLEQLEGLWADIMDEIATTMDPRLRITSHAPQLWRQQVHTWLDDPAAHVLIAEKDSRIIGFMIGLILERPLFYYQQKYGYIAELGVDGHAHVGGVGTALLNPMREWFLAQDIKVVEVAVMHLHPMAQAFWRAKGASEFIDHFWYRLK